MKKILIILMLLFALIASKIAISQKIFPSSNAKWTGVAEYEVNINGYNYYSKNICVWLLNGDTIIDNIQRTKLSYIESVGVNKSDTLLIGYFHEIDSLVYFRPKYGELYFPYMYIMLDDLDTNIDYLFYDFTLNVGDTIHALGIGHWNALNHVYNEGVVTSIDTIELGGYTRKVINFKDSTTNGYCWIEGIGCASGFIEPIIGIPIGEKHYENICYKENDEVIFLRNPNKDCPIEYNNVDIIDISKAILFFPNPTKLNFNIESALPLEKIEIYSINGFLITTINCNNEMQVNINTQSWARGMYFAKITTIAGDITSKKIIIE